ncbi:MAG: GGDEF domain-containing protein, partial [Bacillota bacterium]
MRIMSFGLLVFSLTDIVYYYINFNGLYSPNGLTDIIYISALVIIAVGALWKTYRNASVYKLNVVTNIGKKSRWAYLLLYPAFIFSLTYTGVVKVQLSVIDYMLLAVPVFFYWVLCRYVQISLEKESILRRDNELLEQRVAEQVKELAFLANQDTLTSLFNRRYFMERLNETLSGKCSGDLTALLLMDLDRFKTINDSFGHDVGDKVLTDISSRMTEWNNNGATIARLGGDEFAILLNSTYSRKDIEVFCNQIIEICSRPVKVRNTSLNTTISLGIALAGNEDIDGKTLMQNADIAMYCAKSQGYNKYLFYDPIMSVDFKKEIQI